TGRPFQCSYNHFSQLLHTDLTSAPLVAARIPVSCSALRTSQPPAIVERLDLDQLLATMTYRPIQ
ncbi:MAG: hypothetical protein MJE77_32100, partial [Proteobacteria bacterium]|nr:hypothetical protein [Pseudomonadota bacterium]